MAEINGTANNAKFDAIESRLSVNQWLGGQKPSKEDDEKFSAITHAPDVSIYPNTFAWWALVSRFSQSIRSSWPAALESLNIQVGAKEGTNNLVNLA